MYVQSGVFVVVMAVLTVMLQYIFHNDEMYSLYKVCYVFVQVSAMDEIYVWFQN